MRAPRLRDLIYGHEGKGAALSPEPISVTVKTKAESGLRTQITDAIRNHDLARALAAERDYVETDEEADDFNIGDDAPDQDEIDQDFGVPIPDDDGVDEFDRRLADSFRSVLETLGVQFPTGESAPSPGGDQEGGKNAAKPPSDANGD